jgi:uncharacterized membrane protein
VTYVEVMDGVARAFELVGAAILVLGLAWAFVQAVSTWRRTGQGRAAYGSLRETFGGVLLLGIEVLVAADLVRTVAVDSSLQNVAILGLIVLIRTFLSFSLDIELEGVVPWRKALLDRASGVSGSGARSNRPVVPGLDGSADQSPATGPGRR